MSAQLPLPLSTLIIPGWLHSARLVVCPMSEPMLPASCSLCTVRCFAAPRCIQMTSSSPQDCIAAIQCATTTSGADPRFLALPAHTRRAEANTPRYRFLPRTQILKGKVKSTSAQHTREKSGACFQTLGMQVTLLLAELRCHQGGPQQHLVFLGMCICPLLVLKFTGNPCLTEKPDPSKVIITENKR